MGATQSHSAPGAGGPSRGAALAESQGVDPLAKLLSNNRAWAAEMTKDDPKFFQNLSDHQHPDYFYIGCCDSRVPASEMLGLKPGEVFVQRNVGNQVLHNDLNCMSSLEYAVKELKVKTIIVAGHYNCGAVKAALRLPSRTTGLVNCWISHIRECRNEHQKELRAMDPDDQVARLCELNVLRSTFNVCSSPVVQTAWADGQDLSVYGCIYDVRDGLLRRMVGPLTNSGAEEESESEEDEAGVGADGGSGTAPGAFARVKELVTELPLSAVARSESFDSQQARYSFEASRSEALRTQLYTQIVRHQIHQHEAWPKKYSSGAGAHGVKMVVPTAAPAAVVNSSFTAIAE